MVELPPWRQNQNPKKVAKLGGKVKTDVATKSVAGKVKIDVASKSVEVVSGHIPRVVQPPKRSGDNSRDPRMTISVKARKAEVAHIPT